MPVSGLPFEDFRQLLRQLPERDEQSAALAQRRLRAMSDGSGSLGRLADIAVWLAGWRGRSAPVLRPQVALFAGTHGAPGQPGTERSIDRTRSRVERLASGGAAINQLCLSADIGLNVYDLALDLPVADISRAAALDERGCAATMAFGMEAIAGGIDLFCLGALDGGEISTAAILVALFGGRPADWVTEADDEAAVYCALRFHGKHLADPLEILRRLGGRETAATAGAIIAARMERIPVILEGGAALAAGAVLQAAEPGALDHCLLAAAGGKVEPRAAGHLGLTPLLDLGIANGEGASAVLGAQIVKSAAQVSAVAPAQA